MIIVKTPLRCSLFGGGSDLPEYYRANTEFGSTRYGRVAGFTIDLSTTVVLTKRMDDKIFLGWKEYEIVDKPLDLKHELARWALQCFWDKNNGGIEIKTMADIPTEGTGLGSSASFTVGLIKALAEYNNLEISRDELAREAFHIERNMLGHPGGKQDQYYAAYGGVCLFTFHSWLKEGYAYQDYVRNDQLVYAHKEMGKLESWFSLFKLGEGRKSESVLSEQKENTKHNITLLDKMVEMVPIAAKHITSSHYEPLGEMLHTSWEMKKQLASNISNTMIDEAYAYGREFGSGGGKIMGAGGSGFLLLHHQPEKRGSLVSSMEAKGYQYFPVKISPYGSRVIYNSF